jgi:hypothetical protein
MVPQPPQARVRSGSQSLETGSRTLAEHADNKNNRVANSKLRIIKDH